MGVFNLPTIYFILTIPFFFLGGFFIYKIYVKNTNFNLLGLSKMRNYKYSKMLFSLRIIFLILSFVLLFISVLRPAWGTKKKITEAAGVDVVFTLDVSQSMKALDIGNGSTDRLTMAKTMIGQFVSRHPKNRYGLVIFAGEAFVSTPLTIDTNAFLTFLDGVDYNDIGTQGTNINAALKASIDRFYSEQDKKRGRSIVIISDGGEEMAGDISAFARVARNLNIKIFTVGIGSTKGVPIPEGRDMFGQITYKQYQGKTVISKLNEKILKQIANETGGLYFHAEKKDDLDKITGQLQSLESTVIKTEKNIGEQDRFQYFLFPALLFFLLYIFLEFKDNFADNIYRVKTNIKKYLKISILALIVFSLTGCTDNKIAFRYYNTQGNKKYAKEYYQEAKAQYEKANQSSHSLKYISNNNYAVTEYTEEDYEKADKRLEETVFVYCEKQKKEYCDQLYYNLGNVDYRLGEKKSEEEQATLWQKAINAYKKDLEINPSDKDAQENIDFILDKLNKQKHEKNQAQNDSKNSGQNEKSADARNNGQGNTSQKNDNSQNNAKQDGEQNSRANTNGENKQNQKNAQGEKEGKTQTNSSPSNEQNQGNQASSDKLDEKTNRQIESYMKNLQEQEKNNQNYFQPNPNGSYKDQGLFDDFFNDSFMNDPFFKNFFNNTPFNGKFNGKKENNGIDW